MCMAFGTSTPFLDEWLRTHSRLGVSLFILKNDSALTTAQVTTLAPYQAAGRAILLAEGRWSIAESAALTLVSQPIVRRWMGQLDFLARCIALARTAGVQWLLNADVDEYFLPNASEASLGEALAPFSDRRCLHLRRHNFLVPSSASPMPRPSLLTAAIQRATFPPIAPPKGERRHHGLTQPLHPKWIFNLGHRTARDNVEGVTADLASLVVNQHAILDGSGCADCARAALRPVHGLSASPSREKPQRPHHSSASTGGSVELGTPPSTALTSPSLAADWDRALARDLAALAPFSHAFGAEFNEMVLLDGNESNPCQFPKKCSLASPTHAGTFSAFPPPKQRLLSCFSPTAANLILREQSKQPRKGGYTEWRPPNQSCWRPVCLGSGGGGEAEGGELTLRVHHYGLHGFDATGVGAIVEDRHATHFVAP